MESVPKPPPRRGHLKAPDGDKQKKEGALPALRQGKKGKAASGSFPQHGLPTFVICGENLFCGDALLTMSFLHNSSGSFVPQPLTDDNTSGLSAVGKGGDKAEDGLVQVRMEGLEGWDGAAGSPPLLRAAPFVLQPWGLPGGRRLRPQCRCSLRQS